MSREIKFRGLHPSTKTIMDVCVIDWMHDEVYFEQGTDVSYPIDECNLMQYTGLKDRNGVEIYDGDIAICPDGFKYQCVMDDRGCFVFCNPSDKCDFYFLDDMDWEVIGNIHQNPELLQ